MNTLVMGLISVVVGGGLAAVAAVGLVTTVSETPETTTNSDVVTYDG